MTEASRVQKLLFEQNAEIDRLKSRIGELEEAFRQIENYANIRKVRKNSVAYIMKMIARSALWKESNDD